MANTRVPMIKLNNGAEMPQVGLGLWKVDKNTCADIVYTAIKEGYRLFDGACDYGNETEAGQGIARAIKEGLVTRSELFIISKLWNSFHDAERVEPIVRKQLGDWGIDYFDLYYIHFPVSLQYVDPSVRYPPGWFMNGARKEVVRGKATLQSTWGAMEALVGAGLARSIGISNYNGALVLDLLAYARIVPQVLQIEHHPYLTQAPLLELCRREGIAVTGYSSFGPQSFLGLGMKFAEDFQALFSHPVVVAVAEKHGRTPAQVLLRWSTQRGVAVIPKSSSLKRLRQNLDVCSFNLSEQELKDISALDCGFRFNNPLNYGIPVYNFV